MYLIVLLTEKGIKKITFNSEKESLEELEKQIFNKYGNFTTLKSEKYENNFKNIRNVTGNMVNDLNHWSSSEFNLKY